MRPLLRLNIVFALIPASIGAQAFRPIGTAAPSAELPYEFTQVSEAYELSDGRVVVVDRLLGEVRVADFRSGQTAVLGRSGDGPREYRSPLELIPLGGDSVGIYDDANVRILVVAKSGQLSGFVSPFSLAEGTRLGGLVGDGNGWMYGEQRARSTDDSASIFRWRVAAPDAEFVSRIHRPLPRGAVSLGAGMVKPGSFPGPNTRNQWALDRDGTLAIVAFDPYQVVVVSASGKRVTGPVIAYDRVLVNDSVKRAFVEDRPKAIRGLIVSGGKTTAVSRPVLPPDPSTINWAREVPPFRDDAFVGFSPDGRLWIQRTTFGREGARYDIVDRTGRFSDRVQLPEGHRIIGFGRREMLVVRRDADDLEFLQRRPLSR